ncbi:MAG: hypothetical protein JW744_00380 [Candidatus Diapherotrites archaeon]|uniref:Uncharacterized protein n=1 Tax=Candidatus Iainarchaeum sp. TaxID=3101447 RepID=A0A938YSY2_9ARCH|nr:hypothetical protein [Candidatus Diapherotrites archaeon]
MRKRFERFAENFETFTKNEPVSVLDKKAEQAYEMIQRKGFFSSNDTEYLGVKTKSRRSRLFEKICDRHSNVRLKPSKSGKDNRQITVAYLNEESLKEFEKAPDEEIRKLTQNPVSKKQIADAFGVSEDDAQHLVSRLVGENKLYMDSFGKYKWCGK